MTKYKMIVSYDGTDFAGWQWQQHRPSVAGAIQSSFLKLFNRPIKLIGASRTDAGVHARGQIATFTTDLEVDCATMMLAWNDALPSTIVIKEIAIVDERFHPMCNVAQKTYWYDIFLDRPLPFAQRYGWYFRHKLDMACLHEALQVFVGSHDFRPFATDIDKDKNTVRQIDSITLEKTEFGTWRVIVKGPGFLRHMIRRIVGAALQVASKKQLTPDDLRAILARKKNHQNLLSAPAKGLCLYEVIYKS